MDKKKLTELPERSHCGPLTLDAYEWGLLFLRLGREKVESFEISEAYERQDNSTSIKSGAVSISAVLRAPAEGAE